MVVRACTSNIRLNRERLATDWSWVAGASMVEGREGFLEAVRLTIAYNNRYVGRTGNELLFYVVESPSAHSLI